MEETIKEYLRQQIREHSSDEDFNEELYNDVWVDNTTKRAIEDEFTAEKIVEWANDKKEFDSLSNLNYLIWQLLDAD